jgi:hypothetical protein
MTTAERVYAVADYGFSDRQARFLVLVMRHAGLCVKRQYATFAGIANGGEKCNAFFAKLVRRGFAVATDCIHARAHLYHVHHKPLYHAIGEPDSGFRRAVPARAAAERLMRFDAALISADLEWLTTRDEKLAYLVARTASESPERLRDVSVQLGPMVAERCPGTFPIGIDPAGGVVLVYLATVPWTDDFRTFLIGHTDVLRVASAWTLRIVFPSALRRVVAAYQIVAQEELEQPLSAEQLSQVAHYFFHRRRGTDVHAAPEALRAMLSRYAATFSGPRFIHLYRRWLSDQAAALTPQSPTIRDALASGHGHVDCVVLPFSYEHLSPLVNQRRSPRRRRLMGEQTGEEASRSVNPLINPAP